MTFIVGLLTLAIVLTAGALTMNRAVLLDSPGFGARLKTYLRTNVAATSPQHEFAELTSPVYQAAGTDLMAAVARAGEELGWNVEPGASDTELRFVVTTLLLRFKDDVTVTASPADGETTRVDVVAKSRVGRGDLGANSNHVRKLIELLDQAFKRAPTR